MRVSGAKLKKREDLVQKMARGGSVTQCKGMFGKGNQKRHKRNKREPCPEYCASPAARQQLR